MQKIYTVFVATLLCMAMSSAYSQPLQYIKITPRTKPTSSVEWREVYGRIAYKVRFSVVEKDAKRSFESYLKHSVSELFGNKSGSYILTLSIKNGARDIAKKAIVSFIWSKSKFLFITKKIDIKSSISFDGHLVDHFPITSDNNNLQVKLELHKMDEIKLSTETYNEFSDQVSLLQFGFLQPAVDLNTALKSSIAVMEKVLNSTSKQNLSSDTSMVFINRDNGAPNKVTFSIRGPNPKKGLYKNGVFVDVYFDTERSIVGSFERGKFKNLDLNFVLSKALVGSTGSGVNFIDALGGDSHTKIRNYINELEAETVPKNTTIGIVCRELWDKLAEFYSSRDAPAIYAAFLSRYETVISNASNGKKRCVNKYEKSINNIGIDISSLSIDD